MNENSYKLEYYSDCMETIIGLCDCKKFDPVNNNAIYYLCDVDGFLRTYEGPNHSNYKDMHNYWQLISSFAEAVDKLSQRFKQETGHELPCLERFEFWTMRYANESTT